MKSILYCKRSKYRKGRKKFNSKKWFVYVVWSEIIGSFPR